MQGKLRLDAFLSARLPNASRARLQASIKQGLVLVNGRPGHKPSLSVRGPQEPLPAAACMRHAWVYSV